MSFVNHTDNHDWFIRVDDVFVENHDIFEIQIYAH